ncbi:ParA family protein (plasmid) [Lichenicola cladoniae]|uniref:ParA family protein n=1 Tax=Lichenicola cladoniae TaxID=1484109 RepID=A0A6M8I0K6_9PROT|nr:ParA family protein [Lichenicola cladoniae]NPD69777.1 ParA family protein [Acetobacteraceae bacterium]QKE94040.1 ParA family protein [Lichenicola cladoniae]
MKTIVLASRKGGAGKTTLSCHLAVEAERAGAGPVAVIDTDQMQGLSQWWDARKAAEPVLIRAEPDLATALQLLRDSGAKLVIIDTPPALSGSVAETIALADLVLIPVQPSPDDLRAVGVTVDMVNEAKKPMAFIINRVKPRVRLTGEAAIALSQHGVVAPCFLWDRTDYAAAKTDGLTAPEIDPDGRAAQEVKELWRYVATRLEMTR